MTPLLYIGNEWAYRVYIWYVSRDPIAKMLYMSGVHGMNLQAWT